MGGPGCEAVGAALVEVGTFVKTGSWAWWELWEDVQSVGSPPGLQPTNHRSQQGDTPLPLLCWSCWGGGWNSLRCVINSVVSPLLLSSWVFLLEA